MLQPERYSPDMPRTPLDFPTVRLAPWPRDISLLTRIRAFIEASAELLWLDLCGWYGFRTMHAAVARVPTSTSVPYDALTLVRVAVRDAAIFYIKPVHCLQRSAVVTRMLRRRGLNARLVIGYQLTPVAGHAWVEVNDRVVSDYLSKYLSYRVLDRI